MQAAKRLFFAVALSCVSFASSASADPSDIAAATQTATTSVTPPQIVVTRVTENRAREEGDSPELIGLGLRLYLNVQRTDAIISPSAYGAWHIREARDDQGDDLTPPPSLKTRAATQPHIDLKVIAKAFAELKHATFKSEVGSNDIYTGISRDLAMSKPDFEVELHLGEPIRSARKISVLRGDFTVYTGGDDRKLKFYHLPKRIRTTLDDASLTAAGLKVEVMDPLMSTKGLFIADPPRLLLKFTGDCGVLDQFGSVEIRDGEGSCIPDDTSYFGVPTQTVQDYLVGYPLTRPLDDQMRLIIKCIVGRHTVTVPFELHDIPLP